MSSFFKTILQTIKVFLIFTGCTILFYYGIIWVNQEYQDYHRYDEPNGAAIKASTTIESNDDMSIVDRLILFYLNGE
ncbi:YqzK family protein [Pseudoneobacillus sp. C159]